MTNEYHGRYQGLLHLESYVKATDSLSCSLIRRGLEKEAKHVMRAGGTFCLCHSSTWWDLRNESWEGLSQGLGEPFIHRGGSWGSRRSNTTILSYNQLFYWLATCFATGHCKRRAAVTHPHTFAKGSCGTGEDFRQVTKTSLCQPHTCSRGSVHPLWPVRITIPTSLEKSL